MGKPTGFKEFERKTPMERPVSERIHDYKEVYQPFGEDKLQDQAARCMNCGIPFCHIGCPLGNIIPEFNDLTYNGHWKQAWEVLSATNNFPEFTGRLCPAPCEEACVLGINEPAVTIENIEKHIIEHAFKEGWVKPEPPEERTGKTVAVIGSGPSGLAAAQQLNRAGHTVTVFERADRIGGLLRYGIPDFKLEKWVIDRRLEVLEAEGITFKTNASVGTDLSDDELKSFDAIVLAIGSTKGRDMPILGRDQEGIHFAMDFLPLQNKTCAGDFEKPQICAEGKNVIVIGGGDTGSDCVGTSIRHGAKSVVNFELFPQPPKDRPAHQPWPYWPMKLRTSSSHREAEHDPRNYCILTKEFIGKDGHVTGVKTVNVEFNRERKTGNATMDEVPGSEKIWDADLVLLAMGFTGPEPDNAIQALGIELDERGNIKTTGNYQTSVEKIFAAGDCRRGQSLIVWAISEGRETARCVDEYLMEESCLPTKGNGELPRR
ncbi:glutamate synthase subunit beta [Tichowtungia aerotolerans]|uniref:Glutamate synthase small subunit n=1 Tax=Tichowtungia aerotolerans TaxID=2697043 RepID=A0A6P1M684_9BACT|nr:glutamate synthase subunit beta [Tichowtungia aerotolerans]QHI69367.1 glutamate synthase small subunit [Tichowtungia aerotolerans]